MEDFRRFLTEIVDPTVEEFTANPGSVRHAFLACVVTFHSIDYLAFERKTATRPQGKWGNLRKAYGNASPDFRLVDEVAHVFKHAVTGPRGNEFLSDGVVRHGGAFSSGFSSGFDVTRVTVQGHPDINLLETVKRAVIFLREKAKG
jgi:hypothetical protein